MNVIYTLCFPRNLENGPVFDTRVDHKKAKIPVKLFFYDTRFSDIAICLIYRQYTYIHIYIYIYIQHENIKAPLVCTSMIIYDTGI